MSVLPCASRKVTADGVEHGAEDDCAWERDEVEGYLATYNLMVYHNFMEFEQDKFGEDSVQRKSVLHKHFKVFEAGAFWTMIDI